MMEKNFSFKDYNEQLRFDYCPICKSDGENPDFSLNRLTGEYYCHRTGQGGHYKDLKEIDKDFYKFVKSLLKDYQNYDIKSSKTNINFDKLVKERGRYLLNDEWREYLKGRKIGEKHLNRLFRLGKNNMMMIPITNGKNVVAVKYRGLKKELSCETGSKSDYFINWQHIENRDYLIIVEGEIDLLSGLEAGYENIVSLPFGATNVRAVAQQKSWISEFKKIIIAVDNDEAGRVSFEKIKKELKDISDRVYRVEMGKYKDFNEILMAEGVEKIREVVESAKLVEGVDETMFVEGEKGYFIKLRGELVEITDFTLEIKGYSDRYILGISHNMGIDREFKVKKSELLTLSGIVNNLGYYYGVPALIPSFWSWILKQNKGKYIQEIEHYGIIDNKYYDCSSNVVCDRNDLVIQDINSFEPLTDKEKRWLQKNLLFMRTDPVQSLIGICWALGRMHNHNAYPILELAGSTSVGKTEYAEFITRILFGTKDNIKSLGTISAHQIRSFSSCSNITPWVMDEVKVVGHLLRERIDELTGTIRALYDNKTVNQGNVKDKLYEFKLCTPFIISGETKIDDVSFKNRTITAMLKASNKGEYKIYEQLKNSDILEKLGKTVLENRLKNGVIEIEQERLKRVFPDVKDERQLYNIKCLYIGLQALKNVIKVKKEIENSFIEYLSKIGSEARNVVQNFLELLEMVAESDRDPRTFYTVKDGKHYIWLNLLYKAIVEEHLKTNSTLELIDLRGLRQQLIDSGFIIKTRVSVRFFDQYTRKSKIAQGTEIFPISTFDYLNEVGV